MIAACPKCGARYRIEDGRLPPQGARLRCARCEAVFKVIAPIRQRSGPDAPVPVSPMRSEAAPRRAEGGMPPAAPRDAALVLVADPEPESGRATVAALDSWGLRTQLVQDGVEAILSIQRSLPRVVVLDAALPKMFGFQICELMKRNESLRHIGVVLVGAIHERDRYKRPPSELYGADAYVERPRLVEQLRPILARMGVAPGGPEPAPSSPGREVAAHRAAAGQSSTAGGAQRDASRRSDLPPQRRAAPMPRGATEGSPQGLDPAEIEKAERLARIVVSDIVLYNAERFEAGVAAGDVLSALSEELEEGRSLFRQRIAAPVREARDFLADEMLRVARQRGMK